MVEAGRVALVLACATFACGGAASSRRPPSTCAPSDLLPRDGHARADPVCRSPEGMRFVLARVDLQLLALARWRCDQTCPSLAQLRANTATVGELDPWGSPYSVRCTEDDFQVRSAGPDRAPGTADDLHVRPPLPRLVPDERAQPYPPCPVAPPCPRSPEPTPEPHAPP